MHIHFCYTAQLTTAVGAREETIEMPAETTLAEAVTIIAERHGRQVADLLLDDNGQPRSSIVFSVNNDQVNVNTLLTDGNNVLIMTPMAGG